MALHAIPSGTLGHASKYTCAAESPDGPAPAEADAEFEVQFTQLVSSFPGVVMVAAPPHTPSFP